MCKDISVSFLKDAGYNVVRHPDAVLQPLDLIGVQKGEPRYLGPLNLLIANPPDSLPRILRDTPGADIEGKKSSSLHIGVGVTVLGDLLGAMGSNLGVNLSYTNARRIEFGYSGVLNDSVVPLEVGNYLRDADIDAGNLVLKEYVMGNGKLHLVTKTAKSNTFSVVYERSSGVAASLDVPLLQSIAGGNIKIDSSSAAQGKISFTGSQQIAFAFQSFRVGIDDNGDLSLFVEKPGRLFLSLDQPGGDQPTPIEADGLLTVSRL